MKNKKLAYILLPAVIIIWAIIFYRIFSAQGGNSSTDNLKEHHNMNKTDHSLPDTFSLTGDYRDPFLGKAERANDQPKRNIVTNTAQPAKENIQPASKTWPAVTYSGMIKNQSSSAQLAMIKLNGKSYTIKQGEIIHEVKIIKISRDSIEVSFHGEKRTIKK